MSGEAADSRADPSGRGGVSRSTTPDASGTRWMRFVCAGVRETEATREHESALTSDERPELAW